jgi:hypothetical protein
VTSIDEEEAYNKYLKATLNVKNKIKTVQQNMQKQPLQFQLEFKGQDHM